MRIIGLDIHRAFAEAVAWDEGELNRLGRVDMRRHLLEAFAKKLSKEDVVVIEATGNAASVAAVIAPHVKRVVIANPKQVRIIAHAKIKTDTIDASVLAQLYASGFLPEVWIPDEPTQALRRQVTRRNQIVRQRSRLKNIIQSILHSHLIPSCPHADLCGASGRAWLFHQVLPEDERLAVERHLREFDRLSEDLKVIERDLARSALGDEGVKRLMTIPGVDMVVALAIVAAIGDVRRFEQSQKLVSYLGLNPSVRQSGPGPAYHGRITKQGRGHARGMLVEAAWAAARAPGPLRAFFLRVRARRGQHVAAVATARKLAVLIWHLLSKGESYVWGRPALHARKLRDLELKAGYKAARGQRGAAKEARPTRTISRAIAIRSADGLSKPRRPTRASSLVGIRVVPSGCARAPQTRCDDEGCAAGLAPRALLFAARSPMRERKIAQIPQENTCRSHQSFAGSWSWCANGRCCACSWNRDPALGLICIQSEPWRRVHIGLPMTGRPGLECLLWKRSRRSAGPIFRRGRRSRRSAGTCMFRGKWFGRSSGRTRPSFATNGLGDRCHGLAPGGRSSRLSWIRTTLGRCANA